MDVNGTRFEWPLSVETLCVEDKLEKYLGKKTQKFASNVSLGKKNP